MWVVRAPRVDIEGRGAAGVFVLAAGHAWGGGAPTDAAASSFTPPDDAPCGSGRK